MPCIALRDGTQRSALGQDGDPPFWIEAQDGCDAGRMAASHGQRQNRSFRRLAQNAS